MWNCASNSTRELRELVADSVDDEAYANALFSIESEASIEHIRVADEWASNSPFVWPETSQTKSK